MLRTTFDSVLSYHSISKTRPIVINTRQGIRRTGRFPVNVTEMVVSTHRPTVTDRAMAGSRDIIGPLQSPVPRALLYEDVLDDEREMSIEPELDEEISEVSEEEIPVASAASTMTEEAGKQLNNYVLLYGTFNWFYVLAADTLSILAVLDQVIPPCIPVASYLAPLARCSLINIIPEWGVVFLGSQGRCRLSVLRLCRVGENLQVHREATLPTAPETLFNPISGMCLVKRQGPTDQNVTNSMPGPFLNSKFVYHLYLLFLNMHLHVYEVSFCQHVHLRLLRSE